MRRFFRSLGRLVAGPSQRAGQLLRASLADEVEPVDQGLVTPTALTIDHDDPWLYYAENDEIESRLWRIRPDGVDKQLLASNEWEISYVAVDDSRLWWATDISPKPTTVQVDEHAVYWATADEDTGEGAIWMLCKSAI